MRHHRRGQGRPSLRAILIALVASLVGPAAADPAGAWAAPAQPSLAALVGPERARELSEAQSIVAASSAASSAGSLPLAPRHAGVDGLSAALAAESPDIVVEALFLWRLPPGGVRPEPLAVYNALRAVSSLEGIPYYSASRGRMRTLYERSSLVTGPDGLEALPDRRLAALPPGGETLYARQRDTTFGDNVYRIRLSSGDGYVSQASTNVGPMRLGPIKVAEPEGIGLRAVVLPVEEGLLLYVASSARALMLPGVRGTLETSFGNRARAVFDWLSARMDAEARATR